MTEAFGPDPVEKLLGDIVPSVVMYPPVRPDKYALAHPATFDEREITDHIKLLSNPGDLVFDPMAGSFTTGISSYKKARMFAGIELMEEWFELGKKRISEIIGSEYQYGKHNLFLKQGDSREVMPKMPPGIADLGIFSPPYFDILKNPKGGRAEYRRRLGLPVNYGNSSKDLGNIHDYREFMKQMEIIYRECFRVLKKGKFMVVIVADICSHGQFVPYHIDTVRACQASGFTLKGIQVVMDQWKRKYVYGPPKRLFVNFHHHYGLIFQKN
jgi:DNA modification methylase